MKPEKKDLLWRTLQAVIFLNLGIFLFLVYLMKPRWFGMREFLVDATGVPLDWFGIIMGLAWFFLLLYGAAFLLLYLERFFPGGKFIFLKRLGYLHLPIFLIWNGLLAVMILEAGETHLLPSLQYLYYEYRLYYLLVLALFHSWLSVTLFQRGRAAAGFVRYRNLFGAAGTTFAVGMFLFNGAQHISRGDDRLFPNQVSGKREAVDYVNPLMGTLGPGEYGATGPLVAHPFGITCWTPINQEMSTKGRVYRYHRSKIRGFLAIRRPAVWAGGFAQMSLMPGTGKIKVDREARAMAYRHRDEISTPYYYRVILDPDKSSQIIAEMTATERCGVLRVAFRNRKNPHLVIDGVMDGDSPGFISVDAEAGEITGFRDVEAEKLKKIRSYFVIQFDRAVAGYGTFRNREHFEGSRSIGGKHIGAVVRFRNAEILTARVGTSLVSLAGARNNMRRELPPKSFERVKRKTREAWQKQLKRIEVGGGDEKRMGIFYTALYRNFLFPWKDRKSFWDSRLEKYPDLPAENGVYADRGRVSAWILLSAAGFHSPAPGSEACAFTAPHFPEIRYHPSGGGTFSVTAENISERNRFVHKVTLNGEILRDHYIRRDAIAAGGRLHFVMGDRPKHKNFVKPFSGKFPGKGLMD